MGMKYVYADPRTLRAVAHPLRGALLYELYARGSANATVLAKAVEEPVNSVSFHLRQLAKYGLIQEAPDLATDRRQRWWRPAFSEGIRVSYDKLKDSPGGEVAFEVFRQNSVSNWHLLLDRFFEPRPESDETWVINNVPMLLTHDESREYAEDVYALMTKWAERGKAENPAAADRRTYLAVALVMPHQTDLVAR